jgi:hypothetical protein
LAKGTILKLKTELWQLQLLVWYKLAPGKLANSRGSGYFYVAGYVIFIFFSCFSLFLHVSEQNNHYIFLSYSTLKPFWSGHNWKTHFLQRKHGSA